MRAGELKPTLEQLRRVRAGTLDPSKVPDPLGSYIGHGLGYLCDLFSGWLEADETDRRAVDAALRFYGLSRMPESLRSIALTLRTWGERRGITRRRVEQMIDELIARVEGSAPRLAVKRSAEKLSDPFPPPLSLKGRRKLARVVLWAWADAIDPPSPDGAALMLYEHEHDLRPIGPEPPTREERKRLRRRAWSMLEVAKYRIAEATPTETLVERTLGPRHLALLDKVQAEGIEALMILGISPYAGDVRKALECVRSAVRAGRPEAPELLGLLRDATAQLRSVPADVTSKILVLTAILGRERRDPAGMVAGEQALEHAANVMTGVTSAKSPFAPLVLSDALRAGHEAAQLSYAIGDLGGGWRMIRSTQEALGSFGDPEDEAEPDGWSQQLLLYESSWLRKFALLTRDPDRWLRHADRTAARSSELTFGRGVLPVEWGLNADSQRVGVELDRAEQALEAGDQEAARRIVRTARSQVEDLEANWVSFGGTRADGGANAHVRSGLLSTARASWRAALIDGDWESVEHAREVALHRMLPEASGMSLDKFRALDKRSRSLGFEPPGGLDETNLPDIPGDRGRMRVPNPMR